MKGKDECCGTCKYHFTGISELIYGCNNPASDQYREWTGYEDECNSWEDRDEN